MNSLKDVWDSVLTRLGGELSEVTIRTWFDEVDVVTLEDSAFVLHCSNTFKKSTRPASCPTSRRRCGIFSPRIWR